MMPDAHVERIIRNGVLLLGNPILRWLEPVLGTATRVRHKAGSIHQLHVIQLTDDIHLAIIVLSVAGSYLQLVGVGVVDLKGAILDHVNNVAAGNLLEAGHVAIIWRDHDATISGI